MSGIAHGFFGRKGGVSQGIYRSLNCGPGSKDRPEAVCENRKRVVTVLAPDATLVSLSQIHSAIVHTLVAPFGDQRAEGDAMVTATPGLALGILTADCAPVLLADPKAGVIGAAHAGWKGALGQDGHGVLDACVGAMQTLGATPDDITAVIGPCISQTNYEVGGDFCDRFHKADPANGHFFVPADRAGHFRFDLPGYVAHRLTATGVKTVKMSGMCTYPPENGYFSFRRATHAGEADYGRQISAIVLTR